MTDEEQSPSPNPAEHLAQNIIGLLKRHAMSALTAPGGAPPEVAAVAAAFDAAYAFAQMAGMPRAVALDLSFQVLFMRTAMESQAKQKQSLIVP